MEIWYGYLQAFIDLLPHGIVERCDIDTSLKLRHNPHTYPYD
jgi:hypothetical protein